ncbi:MAG TPA: DNA phosphorothioation system sulfurtransferase DndC [Savagea sp.]
MTKGLLSKLLSTKDDHIKEAKRAIIAAYYSDDRPWVVGYSGGKDSTVITQLIFEALAEENPDDLKKKVYVISSDTLVETPLIVNSINTTLTRIQNKALELGLPIETHKVKPEPNQSFWTNLIGRGYPSPNQTFRWCTDRLKIDPANRFIMDRVSTFGEVIMVLGVREDESASRGASIEQHTVEGQRFMRHSTLTNAYVYAPIRRFSLDDVWDYLLNHPSPWGDDNHDLYRLYKDSNSTECPLIVDQSIKESAGSCGNSRFGCWTCTVVSEDKALTGFIQSGHDWMKPLLNFRNWLASIRDERNMRMKYRANGQIYFKDVIVKEVKGVDRVIIPKKGDRQRSDLPLTAYTVVTRSELSDYVKSNKIDLRGAEDHNLLVSYEETGLDGQPITRYAQLGLGPYTMDARKEILTRLLSVERNLNHPEEEHYELISVEELKEIRKIWSEQGEWEDSIPAIYESVYKGEKKIDWEEDDQPLLSHAQLAQLQMLCDEYNVDPRVLKKLIDIEQEFSGFKIRRGLQDQIASVLTQDYLHL